MPIFKAVDYGYHPEELRSNKGIMYRKVEIHWSRLRTCTASDPAPREPTENDASFLYIVTYSSKYARVNKDRIVYVGLTTKPSSRFTDHHFIKGKLDEPGHVKFSVGLVKFNSLRQKELRADKAVLEELEHIMIWTVSDHLENVKKWQTVPGQGVRGGHAWHIVNMGNYFDDQMPKEIVFPWLITKARDRRRTKEA